MKVMNLLRGSSCKLCRQQSQKRTPTQIIKQMEEKHLVNILTQLLKITLIKIKL